MTAIRRLPYRGQAAVIFVAALIVTAAGSWIPSYWNDEAATLRLARLPLPDLLVFIHEKDAVHAVYAVLMHGWIGAVGESEFAVRLPSAVAIAAATVGLFVLLRDLDRPRAALLASLVFVLLPRSSFNGVEARSSALVTALVVWSAVAAVRAARTGRWWRWAGLAVISGASIAVFLYAALVLPALILLVAAVQPSGRAVLRAVLASFIGVLLSAPVWVIAAGQSGQVGWLATQPVNFFTIIVEPFFGASWWSAALVIVVLAIGALSSDVRRARPLVLAVSAWIVVPLAVLLAGSALVSPMFTPRYLSMSSPAIAILVALVLASPRRRRHTAALLTIALTAAALPSFITARTPLGKPAGQDLRGLAQLLETQSDPGDAVILGDEGTVSLRPRVALAAYPDAFAQLDDIAFRSSYANTGTYSDQLLEPAALIPRLASEDRVWVVDPGPGRPTSLDVDLSRAEFASRSVQHLPTMTVTLWTRS